MLHRILSIPLFIAALVAAPVLAGPDGKTAQDIQMDEIINQLELSEEKRAEVEEVLKNFKQDRRQALKAFRETGESLPPQEEIKAMREYSDRLLEERLRVVLTNTQVEQVMKYRQKQRTERYEKQNKRAGN